MGFPQSVSKEQKKYAIPYLEDGNKGYPMLESLQYLEDENMSIADAYILRGILPSFDPVYDLISEECIEVEELSSTPAGK